MLSTPNPTYALTCFLLFLVHSQSNCTYSYIVAINFVFQTCDLNASKSHLCSIHMAVSIQAFSCSQIARFFRPVRKHAHYATVSLVPQQSRCFKSRNTHTGENGLTLRVAYLPVSEQALFELLKVGKGEELWDLYSNRIID